MVSLTVCEGSGFQPAKLTCLWLENLWDFPVWSLHVLLMCAWILSGYSGFVPLPKGDSVNCPGCILPVTQCHLGFFQKLDKQLSDLSTINLHSLIFFGQWSAAEFVLVLVKWNNGIISCHEGVVHKLLIYLTSRHIVSMCSSWNMKELQWPVPEFTVCTCILSDKAARATLSTLIKVYKYLQKK